MKLSKELKEAIASYKVKNLNFKGKIPDWMKEPDGSITFNYERDVESVTFSPGKVDINFKY